MALFTAIGTAVGFAASAAFAGGIATTAVAATAGYAISQLSKGPEASNAATSVPQAPAVAPPVAPQPTQVAATAEAAVLTRKKAVAKSRTVFTSPLGISGEADVARKTLLGQ